MPQTLRLKPEEITTTEPPSPASNTIRLKPGDISGVEPPPFSPPPDLPRKWWQLPQPGPTWKEIGAESPPGPDQAYGQELIGAGKSALGTAYQAARLPLAAMARPWARAAGKESPSLIGQTPEPLRPTDDAQMIGTAFERIAETLVAPELWGARLGVIVPAIQNMASQAGVNWLQGGTKEEVALATALGALPSGVGVVTRRTGDWIRAWKPETVTKLVERIGKVLPYLGAAYGHHMGETGGAVLGYATGHAGRELGEWIAGKLAGRLGTTSRLPGAAGYTAPWLKPPGVPGVTTEEAVRLLPGLAQPEMQVPSGEQQAPTGKVVIRRPGQKPETVDVYVDAEGRVRLGGGQGETVPRQ